MTLVLKVQGPVTVRARRASSVEIRRPDSAAILQRVDLAPGDTFSLSAGQAIVLIGRTKS
jgi:hypothetical protein